VDGVAVTFVVFSLLLRLIHLLVGFPVHIKGCYGTLLHQRMCFCACCELRIQLIVRCIQMQSFAWDALILKVNYFIQLYVQLKNMH